MHEDYLPDPENLTTMDPISAQTLSQTNPAPLLPWCQSCYEHRTDQSFTSNPHQSFSETLEQHEPVNSVVWEYGIPHGSAHSSSSPFWGESHSQSYPDLTDSVTSQLSSIQTSLGRQLAPLPRGPDQQSLWGNSTSANAMDEICYGPNRECFHDSALNAADAHTPSMYTATMGGETSIQPDIKRSLCHDSNDMMAHESYETDSESTKGEPPYAKLIYNALMEAPDRRLVLRDIYTWISENTDKARDPGFKGWQNSVRHNLSMNGVGSKS